MTARRLRILTLGHSYVVRVNRGIARALATRGDVDLTVAAPSYFHGDLRRLELEPELPGSPLKVVPLGTSRSRIPHIFGYDGAALRRLLEEGDFDVVHAWEEPYVYAGAQIARALSGLRARFCFRTAQSLVKWYPPPFSAFERITRARAQRWIAGGELVFKAMVERGFPHAQGRVLPLGVDTSLFRPSAEQGAFARTGLGLRGPVIGYVGRLTEEKGILQLLKALEGVSGPWSLLLLGAGPLEDTVRIWARRHQLEERVCQLLVKHDEVCEYLPAMDLLVAPSQTTPTWREQFGRMLVEAFACGVPVIGSDSGEIPFVVGDAGRIYPERDTAALSHAIRELLLDPKLRAELARRGLDRAQRLFSHEGLATLYADFYEELAVQGTRVRPARRLPEAQVRVEAPAVLDAVPPPEATSTPERRNYH